MLDTSIRLATLLSTAIFCLSSTTSAQISKQWVEAQEAKLRASTPSAGALFGNSVAKEGDLAVIGAPLDDNIAGSDAGAAYVFRSAGTTWTEVAELIGSAGSSTDLFGESVDVSGSTIVAGASLDDPFGMNAAGTVYVFNECSALWTEVARLIHPAPAPGDRFGIRVAIDGDRIVVGSSLDDTCAVDAGSAFVYVRNHSGTPINPCDDLWTLEAELAPHGCQVGRGFGASVAIQGDRIAIGAPTEDTPEQDRGRVYIFERVGSAWFERVKLAAPDGSAGDGFGNVVAMDGDTVVVGASLDDSPELDRGSAYVFRKILGAWSFEQRLTGSGGGVADAFGFDVGVDGDLAVVTSLRTDDAGESTGAGTLFSRTDSVWTEQQHITAGDAAAGDEFGAALALDGTTLLIGAERDDESLNNSGSAYEFFLSLGNFARFGFGDGSASACPCGNDSHPRLEQGCVNSSGWGGKLSIVGSDSASLDDFRLLAGNLIPGNPALLFHGPNSLNGGAGVVFGNGLRLVGGAVVRAGVFVPDPGGRAAWGPGVGEGLSWLPGSARHFQVWYRDPFHAICGDVFSLTNAVTVIFEP